MRKISKKIIAAVMVLLTVVTAVPSVLAASIVKTEVEVEFLQTDCRTELQMLNDFRTGDDAWVWNSTDTEKIVYTDLNAVEWDYNLEKVAMQRAVEVALGYSHTRTDNTRCFTAYDEAGYSYWAAGENIAAGLTSVSSVFTAWQETNDKYSGQGHRRNMLNGRFNRFAAAGVKLNGVYYWVQEFSYSTSANTATAAVNGKTLASANVSTDLISSVTLTSDTDSLLLTAGETAELPKITTKLKTSNFFGWRGEPTVTADISWSVADSGIAVVSGGKIKAIAPGTTKLIATSALGKTIEISLTVTASGYAVKGTVTSCGSTAQNVTVALYKDGTEIKSVTVTGNSANYKLEGVEAGTYTLKVSKSKHAPREYTVTVKNSDITQNVSVMLYGDVDGSGEIDNKDATQIKRYFNNLSNVIENATDEAEKAYLIKVADVNVDGEVDNKDATQIKRYFNNLSSVLDSLD